MIIRELLKGCKLELDGELTDINMPNDIVESIQEIIDERVKEARDDYTKENLPIEIIDENCKEIEVYLGLNLIQEYINVKNKITSVLL